MVDIDKELRRYLAAYEGPYDLLEQMMAEVEAAVYIEKDRNKIWEELLQSQRRVAELEGQAKLAEWARHDPGCNYIDNAAYGCRCGLLAAQESLSPKDGEG